MYDDQIVQETGFDKIIKELNRLEAILPGNYPEDNIFYKIGNLMRLADNMASVIETIEPFLRHEGYLMAANDCKKLTKAWKQEIGDQNESLDSSSL